MISAGYFPFADSKKFYSNLNNFWVFSFAAWSNFLMELLSLSPWELAWISVTFPVKFSELCYQPGRGKAFFFQQFSISTKWREHLKCFKIKVCSVQQNLYGKKFWYRIYHFRNKSDYWTKMSFWILWMLSFQYFYITWKYKLQG